MTKEQLKEIRIKAGLSYRVAGSKTGFQGQYINMMEKGKRPINSTYLENLKSAILKQNAEMLDYLINNA